MAEKPLISVIVAVYNIEKYISDCMESILGQTYSNLQIIVVDDGSTDSSYDIVERFGTLDKRIEVYHKKNGGLVTTRKEGIRHAKGEYVCFVDGDDYIEPEMYEKMLHYIESSDVDFVHAGFVSRDKGIRQYVPAIQGKMRLDTPEIARKFTAQMVFNDCEEPLVTYSIWSKIFRKDIALLYDEVPEELSYGEDLFFLLKCIHHSKAMMIVDDTLYNYRVVEGSLSRTSVNKRVRGEIILQYHLKNLLDSWEKDQIFDEAVTDYMCRRMEVLIWTVSKDDNIRRFYYPELGELSGKRVIIFGAGKVGKDYYAQCNLDPSITVIKWVDSNAMGTKVMGIEIASPEIVCTEVFDLVVLANNRADFLKEMRETLIQYGVSKDKILCSRPSKYF